ncbi:hypothetical protein B0T21DRAFT_359565 [Apiosordaria backusii]|uniref:Secreted protein n=1 Tax=Apiosordaria backusii TaxID=314023 RepID=A0AA40ETP8_9PEZI|nr:hypothetical protein B0T21DRAFT_359565 [Apiosordaria backusii]
MRSAMIEALLAFCGVLGGLQSKLLISTVAEPDHCYRAQLLSFTGSSAAAYEERNLVCRGVRACLAATRMVT